MEKQQVNGYSDGLGSAHCKTVGLAYVGSNPTPATQTPRSDPMPVFPEAGPQRVRERFGRPFPVAVGQLWARFWLVSGSGDRGAWDRLSGAVIHGAVSPVSISAGQGRFIGRNRWCLVQLCPAESSCGCEVPELAHSI